MIGRRFFLKLFGGGAVAAATGGLPALAAVARASVPSLGMDSTAATIIRPVEARSIDDDYASTLIGLLVNARVRGDDGFTYVDRGAGR